MYPYIKSEKRGLDYVRLNVIDVRTGEVLAWMDEGRRGKHIPASGSKKLKTEHHDSVETEVDAQDTNPFDPTSVFITCLDVRTSKEEIYAHFFSLGQIVRVTKLRDKKSGKFNGSAYVQFRHPQSAEDALYLHGSCVRGCMIMVKRKLKSNQMPAEQVPTANLTPSVEVVVRNFDKSTTQLDIAAHFQSAGDINGVTIVKSNDDEPTEAIIQFKEAQSIEAALWLNNSQLGGSTIVVEEVKYQDCADVATPDSNNNEYDEDSVYVGNMKSLTSEVDLANHFFNVGDISRLTILKNKVTGYRTPSAYIQFKDSASVQVALGLNGSVLNGNVLVVKKKKRSNM